MTKDLCHQKTVTRARWVRSRRGGLLPVLGVWLCVAGVSRAGSIDEWLKAMPPENAEAGAEIYAGFDLHVGETVRALVERSAVTDDATAVRYAVDGWTTHAARPNADPSVRSALATALLEVLSTVEDVETQRFLLSQLGKVGGCDTVVPLGHLLTDPVLGSAAARALQASALPACRSELLDVVLQALAGTEGRPRIVLLQLLGDARASDVRAAVADDLAADDQDRRALALRALARSGDPRAAKRMRTDEAAPYFGEYLHALAARDRQRLAVRLCRERIAAGEPDHQVCQALVELDALLGPAAFTDLAAGLDHPAPAVVATAAGLMADSGAAEVSPWLKQRSASGEAPHRAQALVLLARRGDQDAARLAGRVLDDEDAGVRNAAYQVLAQTGGQNLLLARYVDAAEADRTVILAALLRHHGPALAKAAWEQVEQAPEPAVRATMLEIIVASGDRASAGQALTLIPSQEERVSKQAVKVLQQLAGPDLAPQMLGLLLDSGLPPSVRSGLVAAVVAALNEAADPDARVAPVTEMLPRTDGDVRGDLHRILAGLESTQAVHVLAADAGHPAADTRDSAIRALCKWDGIEAAEPLLKIAGSTPDDTHQGLALRRLVQLVQQYRTGDPEHEDWLAEARDYYLAASTLARREPDQRMIDEALAKLEPEPVADNP